jgi:acyl-CoA synthetase (AMP-forming)/AMP-acid ligase II
VDRLSSLADLLFGGDQPGGSLAVHAGGVDLTLEQVRLGATDIAGALADVGVGPGAPVGAMLPNAAVVAALFGVWRAEGAYVPLNPRLAATDLASALGEVDPVAIVTTAAHAGRFGARSIVVLDGDVGQRPGVPGDRRLDPDVALVQFTSGTTGPPKPVPLRHSTVLALLENVLTSLRGGTSGTGGATKPPMPNLVPVSLSLWAGIYQVLFARLVGAPIVVMDSFESREFAALVERFGIRSTVLPPAAMAMLSDDEGLRSLEPLRYVRSITAPLSPLQARRFRDRFGVAVLNGYGQTEIGGEIIGWTAADSRAYGDDKLGAAGRPHRGVDVRVDEGTGELQIRTPTMVGASAGGLGAELADRLTDDGWFRTGDVGHVDADGFVWIDGRLGEMINRGGLKVFPAEVEEVLRLSPAVGDVAVVGVDDERLGEVPWAFVVPAGGGAGVADPADLAALCRAHLAPFKVPVGFESIDALPRNEVGKVLGRELAARAGAGRRVGR